MNVTDKVAVCSRSFSRHPVLREELLARYAHVTFNEAGSQMNADELVAFLRGHDKAITALDRIDDGILSRLPELKVISKYGVGVDMIDMEAMRRHGKRLGWTGGVNRRSVSELALSFIIALLRHVPASSLEVREGRWQQRSGALLSGRVVGIIGCGHVGKDLVQLLKPFGCTLLAHDIIDYREFYAGHGVEAVALEDLLGRSDVVTLHLPLDDSTRGLLDARRIALMKPGAVLINTARGGLVDESALKAALQAQHLAGAALDVFLEEPPRDRELLALPSLLATPHIGGSSGEAVLAMGRAAILGLDECAIP